MIIVTPYLVRPVSGQLALPTDGYRAPTDVEQVLEGQSFSGVSGPGLSAAGPGARHDRRRRRRRQPRASSCDPPLMQEGSRRCAT